MRTWDNKIDNTAPAATGVLTAAEENASRKEITNAVTTAGLVLDSVAGPDTSLYMLAEAMARYASGGVIGTDGGAANTYVVTAPGAFRVPTALFKPMIVMWYASATNTGASTLNAWGLGTKALLDHTGAALVGGEIVAGRLAAAVYDPALASGVGAYKLMPWANVLLFGGGSGGGDPLLNVGDGLGLVFKGAAGGFNEIRSIKGLGGIVTATNGDVVEVTLGVTLGLVAPQLIAHQTRAGAAGAANLPTDTWTTRVLNLTESNQISGASHDTGTGLITLPAGTYRYAFAAMARDAGNHKARLWNTTTAAKIGEGTTGDSHTDTGTNQLCTPSVGAGRFTLAGTSVIRLEHFKGDEGTGKQGDGSNISPETHLDAWLVITKEA